MDEPTPFLTGEGFTGYATDDPAIVQALAIRKWAYENNLVGPDGQPRKIIGTLPVTADGAIVGGNALVFLRENGVTAEYLTDNFCGLCRHLGNGCCHTFVSMHRSAKVLHSTREAAERAAKGGGDE